MERGIITTVNRRNGVIYCNVDAVHGGKVYNEIPVRNVHSSALFVPKQGEMVAMQELDGEGRVIVAIISYRTEQPEDISEGEVVFQLDKNTRLYFSETGSGYNIELSSSGDLNLAADGKITLSAGGDITLDGQSVVINDIDFGSHTHSSPDGGGTTSGPQ